MPDVSAPSHDCKAIATQVQEKHRPTRPSPSPCCEAPGWWNGWRRVFPVVAGVLGDAATRSEQWLAMAKCSVCRRGFTCYPPGYYPRRQFQLDVVAGAVAQASLGGQSLRQAAAPVGASHTSVWRWARWVAALALPALLYAVATQLDPEAPAGIVPQAAVMAPVRAAAAQVLAALEQVGLALRRVGRGLGAATGLGCVLGWQHQEHGLVVGLRAGLGGLSSGM